MNDNIQHTIDNSQDEVSLKEVILNLQKWLRYLLSKWYIILAFGLLGAALGFIYATHKKPVYTATTTFVLESGGANNLSQYAGLASMVGIDIGGGGGLFQGENILELYKSRNMVSKTLLTSAHFGGSPQLLIDRYISFNELREKWSKKPALKNIHFVATGRYANARQQLIHDSLMAVIIKDITKNYLSVSKIDKKLNIIKVEVKAKDELFAKAFNEGIVQNVNDFYLQTKTQKGVENVAILQQKTDSVRAVMTGAIYRAANVADATPNLNPTRQAQRMAPIQSATASAEVNKAILAELVKNLELSKISLQKETPLIQVVDEPILPLEQDRLGKFKSLIVGGLIGGLIILLILIIRRMYKKIMKDEGI